MPLLRLLKKDICDISKRLLNLSCAVSQGSNYLAESPPTFLTTYKTFTRFKNWPSTLLYFRGGQTKSVWIFDPL